jgi:hypothetical protein
MHNELMNVKSTSFQVDINPDAHEKENPAAIKLYTTFLFFSICTQVCWQSFSLLTSVLKYFLSVCLLLFIDRNYWKIQAVQP